MTVKTGHPELISQIVDDHSHLNVAMRYLSTVSCFLSTAQICLKNRPPAPYRQISFLFHKVGIVIRELHGLVPCRLEHVFRRAFGIANLCAIGGGAL